MGGEKVERRLAAILAADVVGYSRLVGIDEEGTLSALKALRKSLIDPKITEHRGRIVKNTGDGALVEFASAVDAVRCAVETQREMADRGGSQCGYCTPGFIMASAGLLRRNPRPSEDEIREALGSNICRCTGYVKIIEAVRYAAELHAGGVAP